MSFTRVRALLLVGFLAVAAIVVVVLAVARDSQGGPVAGPACPVGAPVASLRLPPGPSQVTVKVFNGTATPGLGARVSADFVDRRFQVQKPAMSRKQVADVAELRYGPEGVGAAQLVQAYFFGKATRAYDPARRGAVVDVVVGAGFQRLGRLTEAHQSLGIIGEAKLPPGACAPTT
ncbi:LytR C-terminal domain-containing protein [Couchioplanes azureus]|uniref:LytR C-terminal domain-containing protein n=1 Tax=Couchioplanes caeruleus TaxID=56438 RepID=UPI00167064AE|nr:LytR C-terminal domain-containing protein [Couchioplanes caeruleus]GGQ59053.1 hypothetical protein GCM10010166_30590 [Couchioplanes caeruleus subsp. azureus]